MSRQAPFVITSYPDDEPSLESISKQASELMPGEIRQPKVQPPTPLLDWGRGESLMWDPHFGGSHGEDHSHGQGQGGIDNGRVISPSPAGRALDEPSHSTPLTGYGRGDNIWGVSPTAADVGGFPGGRSNSDYGGFGVSSGPPAGGTGSLYQGSQPSRGSAQHHPQAHQPQNNWSAGPIGSRPANTNSFTNHQQTYSHSADYGYPGQVRGSPTNPPGPWNQQQQQRGGGQGPIGSAVGANSYQVRGGGDPFGMGGPDRGSFYRDDTNSFPVRSHSQVIADELYHQSLWFPPPPPPRVPKESRRSRAELWYYYASKWDITHMQPPPPRNPLSLMEEEHAEGLPHCTKVPYRGEYWLNRCEYWFNHVQATFRNRQITAESNSPYFLDASFIMNRCVTE